MTPTRCALAALLVLAGPAAQAGSPKISVGGEHMLLLRTDGSVLGWGRNQWNQINPTSSTPVAPVAVPGLSGVVDVLARGSGSLALKADGTVWAWGSAGFVPTGRSDLVQVGGLRQIMKISTGYSATGFAIDRDGKALSWGSNSNGMLGYATAGGNSTNSAQQIPGLSGVVAIAGGGIQAIAVRDTGAAWGWGYNSLNFNDLGTGLFGDGTLPSAVTVLSGALVDVVNTQSNSQGIHMGLSAAGTVQAWGDSNSGIITCGQVRALNVIKYPLATTYAIQGLSGVTAIAGGNGNTLFLNANGSVQGCGDNSDGQLGDGTTVALDSTATPAKAGPLTVGGLPAAVAIATGGYASGAIAANGDVYTWGRKASGTLGDGVDGGNNKQLTALKQALIPNAGALASAGVVYAGTQVGKLNAASIDMGVGMAPADVGAQGQVYAALLLPSGVIYMISPSGYTVLGSTPNVPFMYAGKLSTHYPVHLGDNLDFSGFAGGVLLMGYGVGTGDAALIDMLTKSRFGISVILK